MGRRAKFIDDLDWEQEQRKFLRESGAWPSNMVDVNEKGHDILGETSVRTEVKIVRWKGRLYTAVTLETDSNKEAGTPGWMKYSDAEVLEYYFQTPDGWVGNAWYMPLLRDWFWEGDRYLKYYEHSEPNKASTGGTYHTLSRVVPLADIPDSIYVFRNKVIKYRTCSTPLTG